jgi:NTE family protein
MALPGIFTPAAIGDGIYADGGILNNIPTDVVREMGAEFVIAVNVGSPLYGRDQLDSMLDVLTQSIAVMGIQNDRRNLELADVALTPELEGYTLIDFSDPAEVMDLGYASAASQGEALLAHGLDEARWQAHLADRGSRVRAGTSVPETVGVVGAGETSSRGIERALSRHLNRPLDTDELEPDLTRIVGAGRFASLGYEVIPEGRLVVRAREKSHGPPFLRMGLDVDAATDGNLDISIAARLTAMDFGSAGAEWRTDLRLGTRHAAATEYYRPLGPAGLFFAARAWSRASTEGLFESGNRIAELRTRDHGAGLDLGFSLERSGELRAGYEWRGASARIQTGDPLFPSREGYFRSAFLRWEFEGYDRAIIPTRGVRGRLEARWFSEDGGLVADLIRAELDLAAFHPVSRRGSIFATLGAGRTFRRDPLPVQQFTLGGPFRLSAWNRGEFRDGRFAVGSIGYLHDVGTFLPPLADRLYAAAFLEAGRLYTAPNPTGFLGDFALAFGTPSPLGALWLGGAFGEGGESKVFFRIGRLF